MTTSRLLINGNIEITVQLMPDAYAALTNLKQRDGLNTVDAVNLAVLALDNISTQLTADGTPLHQALNE